MGLDVSPFLQLHKNYVLFQKFLPGNAWDTDLIWHEDQYWPEYLHLVDALGLPDLKMPEMDY